MAISANTNIPTKYGFVKAKELSIGDVVYDMEGRETSVTNIKLSDFDIRIRIKLGNSESLLVSSQQILIGFVGDKERRVPKSSKVQYITAMDSFELSKQRCFTKFLPVKVIGEGIIDIDPWLLGYWLGDGNSWHANVSTHIDDIASIGQQIKNAGYKIGAVRIETSGNQKGATIGINSGFIQNLRNLKLLKNKHIPKMIYGLDWKFRLEVLKGMMDSDGHISLGRGRAIFANTNYDLAIGCARLASSLGELVYITKAPPRITAKGRFFDVHGRQPVYCISWTPRNSPVNFQRKQTRMKGRKVLEKRTTAKSSLEISIQGEKAYEIETSSGTMLISNYYIPIGTGHKAEISRETANKILRTLSVKRTFSKNRENIREIVSLYSPTAYEIYEVENDKRTNEWNRKHILIDGKVYYGIANAAKVVGCSYQTIERAIKKGSGEVWGHSIGLKD